ncbi:MAG: GTP-sensing pleiotropic transcriptional regulator CodY [Clostridiales bacterium]
MEIEILLEKTRRLNQLLQKAAGQMISLTELAQSLRILTEAQVYILDGKGNLLGQAGEGEFSQTQILPEEVKEGVMKPQALEWINNQMKAEANLARKGREGYCLVVPALGASGRIATVIYIRDEKNFESGDMLLAEYGANVAAMQIQRNLEQKLELDARKKTVVQLALEVLSYSELEAVKHIFNEIDGSEGFLVASKLAEEYRLTRSVIVNALRKLESAGVIDARSLGMKGTYIKVLNDFLYQELAAI